MIKIKVGDKIIGTLEDLKPSEKIKQTTIQIGQGSSTQFTDLKGDRKDISNWLEMYEPSEIQFAEDEDGNVWALKNAWISKIEYNIPEESKDTIIIESVDFVAEDLIVRDKNVISKN